MLNLDDSARFEMADDPATTTRIKVLGIGGGGGNAVARMMSAGLGGIEFYVLNTDRQALLSSPVPNKLAIGAKLTNGLGAGANPETGRQAALEDTERIIEAIEGADMVFITAGMGGGTGTGAAPIVASLAKELGALTVAVVTRPFDFEGGRRRRVAEKGLAELAATVDTVIAVPNQRLLDVAGDDTSFVDAFQMADDVLLHAVRGIGDIIMTPGLINRDFADIRAIMAGMGHAILSSATASGPKAAVEAARKAIACPLLDEGGVAGARGLLINISGPRTLRIKDINEACSVVAEATGNDDVHLSFGVVVSEEPDQVKVTVIATGFDRGGAVADPVAAPRPLRSGARKPVPVVVAREPEVVVAAPEPVAAVPDPEPEPEPQPEPEPEPEPVQESLAFAASAAGPPPADPFEPVPQPAPPTKKEDDLDIPAFMRRERRFF
jgi:cell division protein FtsZ